MLKWIGQCRDFIKQQSPPITNILPLVWPNNLDIMRFTDLAQSKGVSIQDMRTCIGFRYNFRKPPSLGTLTPASLLSYKEDYEKRFVEITDKVPDHTYLPTERFHFQFIDSSVALI
jgi:hypothetical protein